MKKLILSSEKFIEDQYFLKITFINDRTNRFVSENFNLNYQYSSDHKTFATTTFRFLVWIAKHKLLSYLIFYKIKFTAYDSHQSFAIDDYLDSISFDDFIKFIYLSGRDVIHFIGQSTTTFLG